MAFVSQVWRMNGCKLTCGIECDQPRIASVNSPRYIVIFTTFGAIFYIKLENTFKIKFFNMLCIFFVLINNPKLWIIKKNYTSNYLIEFPMGRFKCCTHQMFYKHWKCFIGLFFILKCHKFMSRNCVTKVNTLILTCFRRLKPASVK